MVSHVESKMGQIYKTEIDPQLTKNKLKVTKEEKGSRGIN